MFINALESLSFCTKNTVEQKKYFLEILFMMWIENPKVACTSIKKSMFGERQNIHAYVPSVRELSAEMNDYYKFTFVRNPYERLVSCFEDKCIQHPGDPCWEGFRNLLEVRNFNQFIIRIYLIPNEQAEAHFVRQYNLIYDKKGRCLVDFTGKVEHMNEEYKSIRERFNLLPLSHSNRAASLTDRNWMDYYTPFTAWLVYRKYKKDFIAFGYEDEYRKLKDYLKNRKYETRN